MSLDNSFFLNSATQNIINQNDKTSQQISANSANGSTSVSYMDELVKEYLVYRGFNNTLKSFDSDLKQDKDRCFRPDKITEQILSYIYSFDLNNLTDYWSYLDHKYFSRVTLKISTFSVSKRYELNLLRLYLINTIKAYKTDKAIEFLENYASKQQSQAEWKEWYCLPFLKNPEENQLFSIYFSQNWTDAFIVSLQNFLTIVFQSLQFPRLLNYEEDLFCIKNTTKRFSISNHSNFEKDYALNNDLADEFQFSNQNKSNNQENTFINIIKNLTSNSRPKK